MNRPRLSLSFLLFYTSITSASAASLLPGGAVPRFYVRIGSGEERSAKTTVTDRRCSDAAPPALFGCGSGIDSRPLSARGDFGSSAVVDLAIGARMTNRTRLELALTSRSNFALDARANFVGVVGDQPVSADARSLSAQLLVNLDLAAASRAVRPFLFAGAGAARNTIGPSVYLFPSIAAQAATITRGGSHTGFAFSGGGGVSLRLRSNLFLDAGVRYTDLGEFRPPPGPATIVRPSRTFTIDVAGTRAPIRTAGATLSLRFGL